MKKEDLKNAVICRTENTVLEVSRIIRDTRARHLVVLNAKDAPVGIISTVDINNRVVAEEKDAKAMKAEDMMTKEIDTVDLNEDYKAAFEKMVKRNTYSIPVTREGKLLGMLEFTMCMKRIQEENKNANN